MIQPDEELKKIAVELEEIFGEKATAKVWSHLTSLYNRIEELVKSRDNWRKKYEDK